MSKKQLDKEEQALVDAFEAGEFQSELTEARVKELQEAADATARKDKRINIRISSRDLELLKRRALKEGLPYQSLVASILHKYIAGSLKDIESDNNHR
ncbi:CopG family antitoxin [Natronospira bacteriovora]|uniref:CopG family antitoxin n=1 Tax=Natronospira bacteriovora TaxID=3069753 RepID=A0ABU0W864_9GAMM|nr:CopG family antitoxin [Natronospira sp. AB-CW4]MDQ2070109.1 CopG family antitoxin [Natronospira sp. AB-CW4]